MFTLVHVTPAPRGSAKTASLIADYLRYDRQRRHSRPLMHAFAGFALFSLLGGMIGSVPARESYEAAGILLVPVAALLFLNAWRWSRLQHRLGGIRAEIRGAL